MSRLVFSVIPLIMSIALSGCISVAKPREVYSPVTLTKEQIAMLQTAIKDRLKDPDSAKFGTMAAGIDRTGMIEICGYVNSKNSYGDYTGMQPFAASLKPGQAPGIDGPFSEDEGASPLVAICRRGGLQI